MEDLCDERLAEIAAGTSTSVVSAVNKDALMCFGCLYEKNIA